MKITVRLSTRVVSRAAVIEGGRVQRVLFGAATVDGDTEVVPSEWSTVETVIEHDVDAAPGSVLAHEASGDVRRAAVEAHEGAVDAMRCAS